METDKQREIMMLTSYAKDIFIKLCDNEIANYYTAEEYMKDAVNLIKYAKAEFSK